MDISKFKNAGEVNKYISQLERELSDFRSMRVIKAYAIQDKYGPSILLFGTIRKTRGECVKAYTGVWRSENCKGWKKAKAENEVRIVKVKIYVEP